MPDFTIRLPGRPPLLCRYEIHPPDPDEGIYDEWPDYDLYWPKASKSGKLYPAKFRLTLDEEAYVQEACLADDKGYTDYLAEMDWEARRG